MANTKLLEQEVRNLGDGKVRRTFLPFGLTYQTTPETLERLPEIVDEAVEAGQNRQAGALRRDQPRPQLDRLRAGL